MDLLQVMSIEMIISKRVLDQLDISFHEQFGLGTDLSAGEESIFLLDAHEHGAAIRHLAKIIAKHECDENNFYRKWSKPGVLRAKGIVARRMGIKCLQSLLEGFFKSHLLIKKSRNIC